MKRVFGLVVVAETNQHDLGGKIFENHANISRPAVETSCGIPTQKMAEKEDE
jgi:hypothetical protein